MSDEKEAKILKQYFDDEGNITRTLYESQYKASKKYDKENVYNVRLRVPKDWKETIEALAKSSEKSVNKFICDLIEHEIENNR